MALNPVKLRDKAYDSFTERLLARDIKPGQFVSQRELVEMTGMTLGAIRELIPRLEAEGLVTTVPQRGMQIAHVDLNLIRNAYQFRLFLESQATALFAMNRGEEAVARLRAAHEEIIRRAEAGERESLIADAEATDRNLHEAIIDHLENDIVSKAFRVNWIKIKLIRQNETKLYAELVIPVMRDHLKVIEAIERRDAEGAVAAMTAHINASRARAIDMG
ncbi:MAG: GntR family transcriptional regulator [Methylobacterium sp.]|jgi:DNA-binding GntR family transcriptional regulator|nr:GntR family transcriptional regulator [Methylobacterium sp.]MCA3598546.1 GntR family transcriptional regulator [Methylobacterium sp.]MCA3601416.1 GntR family transcriptional regulator [Methylobacterium sp.]MCA3603550.1 GntR family transcriptional regulator [Methylobacterium sp.]MCA3607068.1 GntR family transcriptional regulator [Methylobacterium sp.]